MGYLTVKQFSEKWDITQRRIVKLCNEGRIDGAIKNGMVWMIPEDTIRPSDKRKKSSNYINTQKRVMIVNFNNQLGNELIPMLKKEGFNVDGICSKKQKISIVNQDELTIYKIESDETEEIVQRANKYYEGLVFIGFGQNIIKNQDEFILEFSKKMNSDASIVLIDANKNLNKKLEEDAIDLKKRTGVRINALNLKADLNKDIILNYDEIADDILKLLTGFKNTTGITIDTDGGAVVLNKDGRSANLETGKFYRVLTTYFKKLTKESSMLCTSTMMDDEWTDDPLEMLFRVVNFDAVNRGAKVERIFICDTKNIKPFKDNKTLKILMQTSMDMLIVDYYELKEKEPKLLKNVGSGWNMMNKEIMTIDLPAGGKERGFVSINKNDLKSAYECFQKLKSYAKNLKEILEGGK